MYPAGPCGSGRNMYPVNPGCYPCPIYACPPGPPCNPSPYDGAQVFAGALDIWQEVCLPTFREICLQTSQFPSEHKIYTMFHGTYYEAAKEIIKHGFIPSKNGMLGKGVYVSRDINKARKFPQTSHPRKVVLKLKVNVGRVKKIDRQNHRLQKTWHDHGYDTAWVPPHCGMNPSGQEEDCVYDPRRIKVVDIVDGSECDIRKLRKLLHHG